MHSSSHTAGLRPRQRTFTSCTECRRRKQRCNQAKDRPCNNCARRYPPVICTYESSSPPPSIDRIVDLRDDQAGNQPAVTGPGPAYVQTPPLDIISDILTTGNQYYNAGHGGYYVPTTRDDYRSSYQSDSSNNQYIPATSGGSYVPSDAGYYQSTPIYSAVSSSGGGYYSSAAQQHGDWLSSNGDPGAFVGATSADYYYVCDPDLQNSGSPP